MKKTFLLFVAALLLLGATQCKKEKPEESKVFRLTAYIGAEGDKNIDPNGHVTWNSTDKIFVYNTEGELVSTLDYTGNNTFEGTSFPQGTYNFFYLGSKNGNKWYTAPEEGEHVGRLYVNKVSGGATSTAHSLELCEQVNLRKAAQVQVTGPTATVHMTNEIAIAFLDLSQLDRSNPDYTSIFVTGSGKFTIKINLATGECYGGQLGVMQLPLNVPNLYVPIVPSSSEGTDLFFYSGKVQGPFSEDVQFKPGGQGIMYFEKNKIYRAADRGPINVMENDVPSVTNVSTSKLTSATVDVSFTVTDRAGVATATEYGLFYSETPWPTSMDSPGTITVTGGAGTHTVTLPSLKDNTTYYVRPFARNSSGYAYGHQQTITTPAKPEGTINALFSVSPTKQVYFSQGNLTYVDFTHTWNFYANQYQYGTELPYHIDLFGWGTSGYNHGAVCYSPLSTLTQTFNYHAYGSATSNLCDGNGTADWGYNAINNGGNTENSGWRTLTFDEWSFLIEERQSAPNKIAYAQIMTGFENGDYTYTKGLLLLPDYFVLPSNCNFASIVGPGGYEANSYDALQWQAMQANGAVFLPCAGIRYGTSIRQTNLQGTYWASTSGSEILAGGLLIGSNEPDLSAGALKSMGCSVRLVRDNN